MRWSVGKGCGQSHRLYFPKRFLRFWSSLLLACHCSGAPPKTQFVIGGWAPGTAETFTKQWTPIFETYLNDAVGRLYDPAITFKLVPVDYDEASSIPNLVKAGKVDFIYSAPGSIACLQSEFGFSPIATQRQLSLGKETGAVGSVIYSLASNDHLKNISDFVGKRIGVGQALSIDSFQIGFEVVRDFNIELWRDPSQIIFYQGDYERLMQDVQRGNLDAAFVSSGWFESQHPDQMDQFIFHNIHHLEFESEPYPFLSSSPHLVPQPALTASPDITRQLREQLLEALSALNASSPACQAAGISTFTPPASYHFARTLAEDQGILNHDGTGRWCHRRFDNPYTFVDCPDFHVIDPPLSAMNACGEAGLPCPSGLMCLCRPCIPDLPISMFHWQVVLGLCCSLFSAAMFISIYWRVHLEVWRVASLAGAAVSAAVLAGGKKGKVVAARPRDDSDEERLL